MYLYFLLLPLLLDISHLLFLSFRAVATLFEIDECQEF